MGYKMKVVDTPDYLYLEISGTLNKAVSMQLVDDVVATLLASKYDKLLADIRTLRIEVSVSDDYSRAKQMAKLMAGKNHNIALLTTESDFEASKFFETVSVNMGLQFHAFSNEGAAIKWLMK